MAQIPLIIDIVKKQLRAQGKTYADVAAQLNLSEASVKRLFAEQNFTLARLEAVALMLGYDLTELMALVSQTQQQLTELSVEQEKEIANDLGLLLVTVCVMNRYSFEDIIEDYSLSETECIQKLAKLDRLKLIELHPKNRIKLLISPNFKWRKRGPIQQFFQRHIQQEFFKSNFDKDTEKLSVLNGMLSMQSIKELQKKMQRLGDDFNQLIIDDADKHFKEKLGISLVMAERQWNFSIFNQLNEKIASKT